MGSVPDDRVTEETTREREARVLMAAYGKPATEKKHAAESWRWLYLIGCWSVVIGVFWPGIKGTRLVAAGAFLVALAAWFTSTPSEP